MLLLIKCLIITIALQFSYATVANAQGKVTGRVLIERANPLKNSVVSLASDSLVVRITRTNEDGYFSFNKLPKGNYRILIMITGYEKYVTDFFTLTEAKPAKDFKDIQLQPSTQPIPLQR